MNNNNLVDVFIYEPESAAEIYEPSNRGMKVYPNIIREPFLFAINSFIDLNKEQFKQKREKYIENNQEVFLIYRGPFCEFSSGYGLIDSIVHEYKKLRLESLSGSNFKEGGVLEIKIIRYPSSDLGVGMHLDLSSNINMVSFFNLKGSVTLKIAYDKNRKNEIEIPLRSGDMNIMRAPRSEDEKGMRPLHGIDAVDGERIVLVIREIDEIAEEKANPGNWMAF